MERYDSYKDSGVKWLGEIPSHWELRKMKFSFDERSDKGYPSLPLLAATQNHGVIRKDNYENRTVEASKSLDTLKLVEEGDFVISLRSFQGGIELCHEGGIISPAYTILRPTHIESCYFKHLGKSHIFIQLLKSMVTGIREGQNIDYGKLRDNLLPIPSPKEQDAIANYLDNITSKIDEAIAQQQKMIDLLNERKQIIINNAVTKGLNPNAKMKDSGVEWIGQIPSHWEVLALKHILKLKKNIIGNRASQFDLLSLTLRGIVKRDMENPEGKFPASFDTYQIVQPNDFVFCNFDNEETPRSVGLSSYLGMITGAYDVLSRKNPNLTDRYLLYYFLYIDDAKRFKPLYKGLRKTVPFDAFMSYKIPVPPIAEQDAIVTYLDTATAKIDTAILQQQKMIDLLKERKQIIINDVVTGKVKVL